MTITSDLRGFALACDKQTKKTLLLAADRIDAEIEKLRRELELDMFRGAGEIESYKREASVATRKLAQAEAENDRLVVKLNAEHIHRQNVEAENAKLRELVRHMWRCMSNEYTEIGLDFIACRCDDCEYDNECGRCDFGQRLAELGLGVGS